MGDDYQAAQQDPTFRELWRLRTGDDRDQRLLALYEMGVLVRDQDGRWRYSDAYLSWIFEEA